MSPRSIPAEVLEHGIRPQRFCPSCGEPLVAASDASRLTLPVCRGCGGALAVGPVPAVGVAVLESGRVLLIRRRYPPMEGHWAIPGGFLEAEENPEQCAVRELVEETGLAIRLAGPLGAWRGGGPRSRVLFVCYRGVIEGGRLAAGDDASAAAFFSLWRPPEPLALGPHRQVLALLRDGASVRATPASGARGRSPAGLA